MSIIQPQLPNYTEDMTDFSSVSTWDTKLRESLAQVSDDENYQSSRDEALSKLSFCWRIVRYLAIATQPFMPFQSQRIWDTIGEDGLVSDEMWDSGLDWEAEIFWSGNEPVPLFTMLDLDEILKAEKDLADVGNQDSGDDIIHSVKGGKKKGGKKMDKKIEGIKWLNFEDFMKVELRACIITKVEDHPDADKLYVVKVDDGSESGRTICAGLKPYYSKESMEGKSVVVVCNLEPRKLRGVMSEGMLLAADDENGNVKLITIDGEINSGSRIR